MKWSIPEKVIKRGREYLEAGRVLSVEPDYVNRVWHGEVLGSETYHVTLDGTTKEEDICQCPYWQDHHYCKHTVAVELYLRKEGLNRIIKASDAPAAVSVSQSEMFTKGFSRISLKQADKVSPLAIEFYLEIMETNPYHPELAALGLQLRVGYLALNRFYVVKNINDFLSAWQEEKSFEVNKQNLTLSRGAFDEATNEILQILYGINQSQLLLGTRGLQINGKVDKRRILLPVEYGQNLLLKINQLRQLHFKVDEKNWQQIAFSDELPPLKFSILKEADHYQLAVSQLFTRYFSYYQWGFYEGYFYPLSHRQQEILLTLEQLLKRYKNQQVAYQMQELPDLFKGVLPFLREIGEVYVSPEVTAEIAEYPLAADIIFKLKSKSKQIVSQVNFNYGDNVYSTNPKDQQLAEEKIVLRDYRHEALIKKRFEDFGFQVTAEGFERKLPQGAALYQFFAEELPAFRKLGTVKMGKKLRSLYLDAQHFQPKVTVTESDSWLDVHFDISGISDHEVDQVLQSLMQNQPFYTLENGQVLALDSEEFYQASQFLAEIRGSLQTEDGILHLPKSKSLLVKEKAGVEVELTASFETLTKDLLHPEDFSAKLPANLQAELRNYQKIGFRWFKMLSHYHFGGILADEMGLGKTIQAITYLLSEKQENGEIRAVIVAPASLIYNWQAEIRKFAPSLTSCVVAGPKEEREAQLAQDSDIYITSYAGMRQDGELYQNQQIQYLFLDEAQMVKNSVTKTAQALRELPVPHVFALSGTPIENNLEELWSLFQIIMPGFFPGKTKFRSLDKKLIAQMIKPFVLRRDKKTVLQDLPEKIETNLYSALTEEQKTVYLANLKQMQDSVNAMDPGTFNKNRIGILAGLTRLRQICCDPRLFIEDYNGGSGKLEQVKELVLNAKENNRRILLFSQFTSMLSIIETEFHDLGLETFYLRGSTKAKDRLDMVNAFNEGEKDIFLISLKAGGTGLNLTGADTVILYDLWWNPAVEEQAAGRAHRIGQKNVVEVWRMIAEGTIEERMDLLQKGKKELFQQVIEGDQEQLARLTEEDIRMILSVGEA
ncbi:DEAD/DEAH box helicase [Enterococcus sp. LJL120]